MIKSAKNKMVGEEKEVKEVEKYFYPDHQVTIEASSKEEADEIYKKKHNK